MKPLKLIIGTLFLPTAISLAIVDTNENGLSDLWEQTHNNGDLFPITYDPQADPDQDGWTNAQEAAAGTDPGDPNPPAGIIAPDLIHTPAVMGTDGNGQPIIITPEVLTVSWPTLIGKQYTLLFSPDLSAGGWLQVPQSTFIGDGNIHDFNFDLTSGDRCFWRVSVTDCDTDQDGLTDAEEHTLGTNSNLADTDFDGLPDIWEITNGIDPLDDGSVLAVNGANGDPDGDGKSNAEEFAEKTNPKDDNDFQPEWVWAKNRVDAFTFYSEDDPDEGEMNFFPWDENPIPKEFLSEALQPATVHSELTSLPYPEDGQDALSAPFQQVGSIGLDWGSYAGAHSSFYMTPESETFGFSDATFVSSRVWLHIPSNVAARDIPFLKLTVHERSGAGIPTTKNLVSAEVIQIQVPASSSWSDPVDLDTTTQAENGVTHQHSVELSRVRIVPDAGMAGVVGDVVPSTIPHSFVEHFVTPKQTTEINQTHVELKATGIEPARFAEYLEWEGGEAGSSPERRKVSRAASGKTELTIKAKSGGAVLAKMIVWVVWADGSVAVKEGPHIAFQNSRSVISSLIYYEFIVAPHEIVHDGERPELNGVNESEVPNPDKTHIFKGEPLRGGANLKWDVSRQVRIRVYNRKLYPASVFYTAPGGRLGDGQPAVETMPEDFPVDPVEGNDDVSTNDETNNPYNPTAKLTSDDTPKFSMSNSMGQHGDTLTLKAHFREFVRLNVSSKWYRISDYKPWKVHFEFKKSSGIWTNNGSLLQENNDGWDDES